MRYDLVATDFDDTLYSMKGGGIDDFTLGVIGEYKRRGGKFVIVTGRMFSAIKPQAEKLGLSGLIISYQGAMISDISSGKTLKCFELDRDLCLEYLEFLKDFDLKAVQLYADDRLTVEEDNEYVKNYRTYCGVDVDVVGDLPSFIKAHPEKTLNKVYVATYPEEATRLRIVAEKAFSGRLNVTSSKEYNVEVVNPLASKGNALKYLMDGFGVEKAKVMCFGDQLNDVSLLTEAGMGVAVANANPELKKIADYVSEACEDDGVAKTITKFCLEEN